jgi:hypothetical protein
MRSVSLLLVGATLVGCSTYAPAPRAPDAEAQLQTMLAGKVAGPAVRCIPSHAADNMLVVDDRTILFRDGARRVWRNDLNGGACHGLSFGGTLVTKREVGTSSLCRGDISHVVTSSGSTTSTCVFGDFVPYSTPGA